MSRLNRQIEEAVYNIKPEDYDESGDLKTPNYLEVVGSGGEYTDHRGVPGLKAIEEVFERGPSEEEDKH
jgi:hypothetical protein